MSEPTVEVTRYEVSSLPAGHIDRYLFTIVVEQRDPGRWAVMERGWCIAADGERTYEPIPSSRTDEFLAAHRFDLETAMTIARREAPLLKINGLTVADVLARSGVSHD